MADSSSSETNVPVHEWSTGTLKIYHDDKINAVQLVAEAEFKRVDSDIDKLNTLLDERSVAQEKAVNAALISAKEAVDRAAVAQEKAIGAALTATQEAIGKSDTATEKRFESVNEFRKTLSDQTGTFLPRPEYSAQHKALEDRVTDLTNRMNLTAGEKQGSDITIGKIYAAIGVVGAILGILVLLANNVL